MCASERKIIGATIPDVELALTEQNGGALLQDADCAHRQRLPIRQRRSQSRTSSEANSKQFPASFDFPVTARLEFHRLCCASRAVGRTTVTLITLISLIGCTTTQERGRPLTREEQLKKDQRSTVVQGHTVGTVIGAGVGGGIGFGLGMLLAALSKNERQRGQIVAALTIAGATAGARVGYVKGGEWGRRVARKKADYASTEQYLGYCINDARTLRVKAEQETIKLRNQLQSSKQKLASGRLSPKQRQSENTKIVKENENTQLRIQRLDLEVRAQRQILAETGDRQKTQAERGVLRSEINKLEEEKQKMQQYNSQLAQLGNRFSA